MMGNFWTRNAAGLAVAFSAALAAPTLAQDAQKTLGAPEISPERLDIIRQCEEKLMAFIDARDTRADGIGFESYYLYNDANKEAIRTAVKTGEYEAELDALDAWSQLQTMAAYSLVMNQGFHCAFLADENGDLDNTRGGDEQLEMYGEWTDILVNSSNKMHDILKMLKEEGDKLIANGVTPPSPYEHVPMFR